MKKLLIAVSIGSLFSCKENVNSELRAFIDKLPQDTLLSIPTFDGSNQVVHPDVLFKNNQLLLALTPYPYYNDSLENPCLYKSKDGIQYEEYIAGINPLVPTPVMDHNSDPDILFNENGDLVIFYLETMRPNTNKVIALTINDKTSEISSKTVIEYNLSKQEDLILSPSLAEIGKKKKLYYLYFVDMDVASDRIQYIESTTLYSFDKSQTKKNSISFPSDYVPWHLDVIRSNQTYYLVTNGYYGDPADKNYSLFLAESNDLIHWKNNREILTPNDVPDKTLKYLYRSSGLILNKTLALWYSYVTVDNVWKIAIKKLLL
jgi:hypothetical protein